MKFFLDHIKKHLSISFPIGIIAGMLLWAVIYTIGKSGTGFYNKTLWDLLELIIVPFTLSFTALIFAELQKNKEQEIALEKNRDDILQRYLENVKSIILNTQVPNDKEKSVIRTLTLLALQQLDGRKKRVIIKFLFDAKLIVSETRNTRNQVENIITPQISLSGADLSNIDLNNEIFFFQEHGIDDSLETSIDLSGTNLLKANLCNADLQKANLNSANLNRANLSHSRVQYSSCIDTVFDFANLQYATFTDCDLRKASLKNSNCDHTYFGGAIFFDTIYPNNGDPFIDKAEFDGANLRHSVFSDAEILPKQFLSTKKLWRTRLPSFFLLYSRLHPLFEIITGGKFLEDGQFPKYGNLIGGKCLCGEPLMIDRKQEDLKEDYSEKEALKELWDRYSEHDRNILRKNFISKLRFILFEYERPYLKPDENFIEKVWDHIKIFRKL